MYQYAVILIEELFIAIVCYIPKHMIYEICSLFIFS